MSDSKDVEDHNHSDKSTQTPIQHEEDNSNIKESETSLHSFKSSTQDENFDNNIRVVAITGIDEQIQCDSQDLTISFRSCNSSTSNEKIEVVPKIPLDENLSSPKSSKSNEKSRESSKLVSNNEIDQQKHSDSNNLNTTCSCKQARSGENLPDNSVIVNEPAKVYKQKQCALNELNKINSSPNISKKNGSIDKQSLLAISAVIDKHQNFNSGNSKSSYHSCRSSRSKEEFEINPIIVSNSDLNELKKTLSVFLKKHEEISENKCKPDYCKCLETDQYKSIKFKENAKEQNFDDNSKVPSSENNTKATQTHENNHEKSVGTVTTATSLIDFTNIPLTYGICPALQKSGNGVGSMRLESKLLSKMTQTTESNFSSNLHQRSFWPTSCLRSYIGPSLDETLFYTVESMPVFKQFAQNILPRTCGGNPRNDDEDLDSLDGNI